MDIRRWIGNAAKQVRSKHVKLTPASLQDSYSAAFFLAKRIRWRVQDLTIMVGDDSHGMHHWLESKRLAIFIDPAAEHGVRIGNLDSPEYTESYFDGQDSRFRVDVPRDHPRYVYAPVTVETPERTDE